MKKQKFYPESKVEIQGFMARKYDFLLNTASLGFYGKFIRAAVAAMDIRADEKILDLGCGTGRNACLMAQYLNGGSITGIDISDEMGAQFKANCSHLPNTDFLNQRIDVPFSLQEAFDRAFISFVLHGFPQEVRLQIIKNAYDNLKPGGLFSILDFAEFSLKEMPVYYRVPFKILECPYAFDYVERDWKSILAEQGFERSTEKMWFKNYVRLLTVKKI